ncbi:MAG: response regulator transcription factor [Burkholderiaceae bacterium]
MIEPSPAPGSAAPPLRLMLIDDHPLVRDGLKLHLDNVPHLRVTGEAADADGALAQLERLDAQADGAALPHLILMDLSLRGVNGLTLTAQVCERWPQIAVIVLSMHDNPAYVTQAIRAGARGYLLKDEPARQILAAIDTVLGGSVYFSPAIAARLTQANLPGLVLTARERDILRRIGEGLANKQIAQMLGLSVRTVETHRLNIKRKLGIAGQAELIRYALEHRHD